jgi:hypothetical protein
MAPERWGRGLKSTSAREGDIGYLSVWKWSVNKFLSLEATANLRRHRFEHV